MVKFVKFLLKWLGLVAHAAFQCETAVITWRKAVSTPVVIACWVSFINGISYLVFSLLIAGGIGWAEKYSAPGILSWLRYLAGESSALLFVLNLIVLFFTGLIPGLRWLSYTLVSLSNNILISIPVVLIGNTIKITACVFIGESIFEERYKGLISNFLYWFLGKLGQLFCRISRVIKKEA